MRVRSSGAAEDKIGNDPRAGQGTEFGATSPNAKSKRQRPAGGSRLSFYSKPPPFPFARDLGAAPIPQAARVNCGNLRGLWALGAVNYATASRAKRRPGATSEARKPRKPRKSGRGLWADLNIDLSAEVIDEARREMWKDFRQG